jgi:hypothetical protein
MTQEFQKTENIVIDNVEHALDKFSPQVRGMVSLRDTWVNEANKERSALTKTEAAIRQLDSELGEVIKAELEAQKQIEEEAAARQENIEAKKPAKRLLRRPQLRRKQNERSPHRI